MDHILILFTGMEQACNNARDDVIVMRPKVFLGHVECYYFVSEAILKFCTE